MPQKASPQGRRGASPARKKGRGSHHKGYRRVADVAPLPREPKLRMPQFPTAAAMPVQRPAARLDAFDADNTETFVDERSPVVDETVNKYLRREGLGGAALCDLRRFLQEVEASVTSCSDVELGGLDDALTYGETFIRVGGRSTSTFEDKARKLSEKHAVMRKVSTAESDAEVRDRAMAAFEAVRPVRKMPTSVSDIEGLLGWLDRHIDPEQLAQKQKERNFLESLEKRRRPVESRVEKGLLRWRKRAAQRLLAKARGDEWQQQEQREPTASRASRASRTAGRRSTQGGGGGGGGGAADAAKGRTRGWLVDLRKQVEAESSSPGAGESIWERQARMEVEARRRQKQKLRSTFATWRTDREEEEEEEEEIANLTLNGRTTDETIANFQKRLPELEQRKRDAKAALNEAETRLRQVLGRRPLEIDRRDDVVWARAALAYQEADEALCLAQALTTWED